MSWWSLERLPKSVSEAVSKREAPVLAPAESETTWVAKLLRYNSLGDASDAATVDCIVCIINSV